MKRHGSALIVVLLILFLVMALILAALYATQLSMAINQMVAQKQLESVNVYSLTQYLHYKILTENEANQREVASVAIEEQLYDYSISYGQITSIDKKFLKISSQATTSQNHLTKQLSFSPLVLLDYAHFVICPNDSLGTSGFREHVLGIARANKVNNIFENVMANNVETGKPYFYMQPMNLNKFVDMSYNNSGIVLDISSNPHDVNIIFADNNNVIVDGVAFVLNTLSMIIKTADDMESQQTIYIDGMNSSSGEHASIVIPENVYISLATDARIVINEEIFNENDSNTCGLLLMTTKTNTNTAAIEFDINQYISNNLYSNNGNTNVNSMFYGVSDGILDVNQEINQIHLAAILYAENGSFGIMPKAFNSPDYNSDVVNTFYVYGGIIEFYNGYEFKNFDVVPTDYFHLVCESNSTFLAINDDEVFKFPILPNSKTFFVFNNNLI